MATTWPNQKRWNRFWNRFDIPISWSDDREDPSGDAQLFGLEAGDPERLTLRDNAKVLRLHVNPNGREVKAVEAELEGDTWLFRADVVVLAAGAVNTPVILLRSANSHHPKGISNGSDQVGRNLMNLQLTSILQLATERNSGRYGRSLGINDYYWGDKNVSFPLGHIQTAGGVLQDVLFAESPPVLSLVSKLIPDFGLERLASRSVAWWAMTEVMPDLAAQQPDPHQLHPQQPRSSRSTRLSMDRHLERGGEGPDHQSGAEGSHPCPW